MDTEKIRTIEKNTAFDSEIGAFHQIATELGMKRDPENAHVFLRHPLVYLVEAADDICYNIIDLEDAYRLKILTYDEVETLLLPLCRGEDITGRLRSLNDLSSRIELLRAKAINTLINACVDVFVEHQDQFLEGTFDKALMDALDDSIVSHMRDIEKLSYERIYNAPAVVQIEIAGFNVMNALLEEFVPAYLKENKSMFDKKLVAMIPNQFKTCSNDPYIKIRAVLDFVSGMTDIYAVDLYRKIKGIAVATL